MSMRLRPSYLASFLAAAALLGVAACENDPLSGPAKIVGDVLLDMTVSPAATTIPPSGSIAISGGNRDTVTVTLSNLSPLPAGVWYQVLLAADSAARAGADNALPHLRPVTGRIIRTRRAARPVNRDSTAITPSTDTVQSGPLILSTVDTNETYVMRFIGVQQGTPAVDSVRKYTHVVVVVTPNPLVTGTQIAPTSRTGFLFAMFRDTKGTVPTTDDTFGGTTFTIGSWTVNRGSLFRFGAVGSVNGAIRGRDLRINYRGLLRPPQGFRYASWLIDSRTGAQVRIGELRTPEPGSTSLADADIGNAAYLTRDGIVSAEVRANADDLGIEFDNFSRYALVLEAKGSPPARAPGWEIMVGPIPQSVASRHPSPGTITGNVTRTGGGTVTGTTLYLTGVGLSNTLAVTNADATGFFRFRTANVGTYTLHAIAPGGTSDAATQTVTVGTHLDPAGITRGDSVHVAVTIP